jgi:hypothetical protein
MLSSHRWNRKQNGGRLAADCSAGVGDHVAEPILAGVGCGPAAPSVHGVGLDLIERRILPRVKGAASDDQASAGVNSMIPASAAGNHCRGRRPGGRGRRLAAGNLAAVSPLRVPRAEVLDELLAAECWYYRIVAASRMPVESISWARLGARGSLSILLALEPCTCIMW